MNFNKRSFWVITIGIASVGYLFSIATGSIGLMIIVLGWIINYKQIHFSKANILTPLLMLCLFYLGIILCSLHSLDPHQAQKEIVRFLSFIVFPIVFYLSPPLKLRERKTILRIFIWSLLTFFLVCFIVAWKRQMVRWEGGSDFNWYFFYRYDFLEVFNQHPTYVSMFTLLALSFMHFLPKSEAVFSSKTVLGIVTLNLSLAIILYGSRMGYVLYVLLGAIYTVRLLWRGKYKEFLNLLFLLGVMGLGAWNIPIVKERFLYTAGKNYDYKYNDKTEVIDGTPEKQGRLLLWQDTWELIEERPIVGYGTGASKKMLLKKYQQNGHTLFLREKYNAHNTYLEITLWGGIPLLFAYILLLLTLLSWSHRKKDFVLFSFFLIIAITGITETLFLAQGIMFFSFFICFLTQKYFYNQGWKKIVGQNLKVGN